MINLGSLSFDPIVDKLTDIFMKKTQNDNPIFFQVLISYFLTKVASMMRTTVAVEGTDTLIPVNMYAINLAPSGSGKGHSISILEDEVLCGFRGEYMSKVFWPTATKTLAKIALRRSISKGTSEEDELTRVTEEFEEMGNMPFAFDSATTAAIKQMRTKLLMAGSGSMNMEIDEIGSNFMSNMDVLTSFLELFDLGRIKQKLVKNTKENSRAEDLFGITPTNMLLFGTPVKLLNGSKTEDEFHEMLNIGLARRCFFGYTRSHPKRRKYTAQDIYDINTNQDHKDFLADLNARITVLADNSMFARHIIVPKATALELYDYKIRCEEHAATLSDYEDSKKTELTHRHFKAQKLAATYAFIHQSYEVQPQHLEHAIALTEASGRAFWDILERDRPHVKLAQYITTIGREVTQADLVDDLPFYKGTEANKRDMMTLAIAYGYKNNMVIKKQTIDDVEFITGSSIPENDPSKSRISFSTDITKNYLNQEVPFESLHKLFCRPGYHWTNHQLEDA